MNVCGTYIKFNRPGSRFCEQLGGTSVLVVVNTQHRTNIDLIVVHVVQSHLYPECLLGANLFWRNYQITTETIGNINKITLRR